jgi:hypothetical protein
MYKRDERLRHLYITAIRFLAGELYNRCVRKLYIGYPLYLAKKTAMNITVCIIIVYNTILIDGGLGRSYYGLLIYL